MLIWKRCASEGLGTGVTNFRHLCTCKANEESIRGSAKVTHTIAAYRSSLNATCSDLIDAPLVALCRSATRRAWQLLSKVCRFQIKIHTLKRSWFTDSIEEWDYQKTTEWLPKRSPAKPSWVDSKCRSSAMCILIMWFINTFFRLQWWVRVWVKTRDSRSRKFTRLGWLHQPVMLTEHCSRFAEFRIIGGDNLMNCRIVAHIMRTARAPCQSCAFQLYEPATLPKTTLVT